MPRNFRREERDQVWLFPPSINDYLPADHDARFLRELVVRIDAEGGLKFFYESYREDGRGGKAYHPVTMIMILAFAYSRGITSSRRIQRECVENVAFRFLSANQTPDFRSIADFRKRHLDAFSSLFLQILQLCDKAGLVGHKRGAVDGRRVQGNASLDKTFKEETLNRELEKLAQEILEEAERVDREEDAAQGGHNEHFLPPHLRTLEGRKAAIESALAELNDQKAKKQKKHEERLEKRKAEEARAGRKKPGTPPEQPDVGKTKRKKPLRANTTDPESRIMKSRKGFKQGYNAQIMADQKRGVITACFVTQEANDQRQLEPALIQAQQNLGRLPKQIVADAGYWTLVNAELCEFQESELYIATKKDSRQRTTAMRAVAPRGRIPKNASPRERMDRKLATKKGKEAYRRRGQIAETPFAAMVNLGLSRFILRGLDAVAGEWNLWCAVLNLKKLQRYAPQVAMG